MKILNLYAGIGGNRRLWDDKHNITAVEIDENIAKIYQDFFPKDKVIVGDAHEYLRQHFKEFDFIWASPPCQTHSKMRLTQPREKEKKYPDLSLYQEIIFLKFFFKGNWIIENVRPYYRPLITPSFEIGRHFFWSNKYILINKLNDGKFSRIKESLANLQKEYKINLDRYNYSYRKKVRMLRNCVVPETGKFILDYISEMDKEKKNG